MAEILDNALTPEEWSQKLRLRGIYLSPRTLRTKARFYKQFYSLGRQMVLLPEHIDEMLRLEAKKNQDGIVVNPA